MSQTLELDPVFSREWEGKDPFTELEKTEGEIFRQVKSRRTFRFEVDGHGYFAKVHRGVGWREIFKNLLMGKRPVLSAANEYRAIRRLEELGVDTMTIAAYGCRGWNPAKLLGIPAGTLQAGAPGDVVVFDPEKRWTVDAGALHGKSRNTPFKGMTLQGKVVMTIFHGRIVYDGR